MAGQMRWFVWIVGLFLVCVACAAEPAAETAGLQLEPCRLDGEIAAECGRLSVPENRAEPNGRQIELAIVVVPAVSNNRAPDPLFLLAGGPGQAAVETFERALPLFEDIRDERDIVLFDQRGTGKSNGLTCENLEQLPFDATQAEALQAVEVCRTTLESRADLTQYGTAVAAQDLDAVRAALGYEQVNLYGVSYGTRLAQEYARQFPEMTRTLTLDAVTSNEFVLYQEIAADGAAALDLMFFRCNHSVACLTQFPDLRDKYEAVMARLETPQTVLFEHPSTGRMEQVELNRPLASQIIFNLLYSPEVVGLLPLMITETYESGDYSTLVAQGVAANEGSELAAGLLYSIACTEDIPLLEVGEDVTADFNAVQHDFVALCERWVSQQPDPAWREPLTADIPTLLLSGSADPITPPRYADQVAEQLPHSLHIVANGFGHGLLTVGCTLEVVEDFLASAAVDGLEPSCIRNVAPPPFFLSFTGPAP